MRMTFCVFIAGRFVGLARILVTRRRAGAFARWSLIGRSFMTMAMMTRGTATSPSAWTSKPMMAAPSTRTTPSMRATIAVRTEETWAASPFKAEMLETRSWLVNTSSSAIGCIHGTDEVPERD